MDYMREALRSDPLQTRCPTTPTVSARAQAALGLNRAFATLRALGLGVLLLLGGYAGAQTGGERVSPQALLPMTEITAGMHVIRAEVADTGERRMKGLMMRERLGPNEGMLFVFEYKAGHCFWMKNTLIPLTIAFVEDDGTIVNLADMSPKSEQSHCPTRPIRYALEMERGWFSKRGLAAGSRLSHPSLFQSSPARP